MDLKNSEKYEEENNLSINAQGQELKTSGVCSIIISTAMVIFMAIYVERSR